MVGALVKAGIVPNNQGIGTGVEEESVGVTRNGVRSTGVSVLELIPRASPTFGQTSKLAVSERMTKLPLTLPRSIRLEVLKPAPPSIHRWLAVRFEANHEVIAYCIPKEA